MGSGIIDITGNTFGKLTVLEFREIKSRTAYWLCKCECGKETVVEGRMLRKGNTRSCGCIKGIKGVGYVRPPRTNMPRVSHGKSTTRIYKIWTNVKARCQNPNNPSYADYGGRGIAICDKWQTFEGFYEDMGDSYREGLSIERKDVNGDYCAGNCIWADYVVQNNNTRFSKYRSVFGVTDTLPNLCRKFNVSHVMVKMRLKRGWSIEDAFNTPKRI